MNLVITAQVWLLIAIAVIGSATSGFGLVHAALTPAQVFRSADKRSKGFWLAITAAGLVLGILSFPTGIGGRIIFGIISVVAGLVYITDIYPALRRYRKRRGGGGGGGYSGGSGGHGWRQW